MRLGRRILRSGLGEVARDDRERERDADGACRYAGQRRTGEAQDRDEKETCRQRADRRASRVGTVERPDDLPGRVRGEASVGVQAISYTSPAKPEHEYASRSHRSVIAGECSPQVDQAGPIQT